MDKGLPPETPEDDLPPEELKAHLREEHGWTDDTFRHDDCRNLIELAARHRRLHA